MRLESQLKAIIEAQVKGRKHPDEQKYAGMPLEIDDFGIVTMDGAIIPVLLILLDTEGCKSAYPGIAGEAELPLALAYILQETKKDIVWNWYIASVLILDAWNHGDGNNWRKAIETAYNLLSKE